MNLIAQPETGEKKSQAELLYQAQLRKQRHFRANVAVTWFLLLLFLVYCIWGTPMQLYGVRLQFLLKQG